MKEKKTIPKDRKPPVKVNPFGRCAVCRRALDTQGGHNGSGLCETCAKM